MMMIDFLLQLLSFFCLSCQATMLRPCLFGPSLLILLSLDLVDVVGWALLFCIATKELHYWSKTFKPSSTAKKGQKKELLHDLGNSRPWMIWWARFIYLLLITDIYHITLYNKFFWKWNCPTFEDNKHSNHLWEILKCWKLSVYSAGNSKIVYSTEILKSPISYILH